MASPPTTGIYARRWSRGGKSAPEWIDRYFDGYPISGHARQLGLYRGANNLVPDIVVGTGLAIDPGRRRLMKSKAAPAIRLDCVLGPSTPRLRPAAMSTKRLNREILAARRCSLPTLIRRLAAIPLSTKAGAGGSRSVGTSSSCPLSEQSSMQIRALKHHSFRSRLSRTRAARSA